MKRMKVVFLIAGIVILGILFRSFGVEATLHRITSIGWRFAIIVGIFFFTNLFLTLAWFIIIPYPLKKRDLWKFSLARLAGDSTTSINAIGAFAGEPLKALYVKDILPFKVGLASVILDRVIKTMSGILLSITGIFASLFIMDIPLPITLTALALGILSLAALFLVLKRKRHGFLEALLRMLPLWLMARIMNEGRWEKVRSLDSEISYIFSSRENMNHFYVSLTLHYLSILISCSLEIYLIALYLGVGDNFQIHDGFFVYVFGFIITSLIFFMPANVGTSEGSYSLALQLLGFDPVYGLSIGIIRRLRTFVWSGIGMLILFYAGLIKKDPGD